MARAGIAICDQCSDTISHSEVLIQPLGWYRVNRRTSRYTDDTWLCSAACLLAWSAAELGAHTGQDFEWDFVPMTRPGSSIVHAVPFGFGDEEIWTICHSTRVDRLEVAVGEGLRPCKRCRPFADRVEPTWWTSHDDVEAAR